MPKSTILLDLIERRSWDAALERIESHPDEAAVELSRGIGMSLPLYEACKLQPPAMFVKKLIEVHPPALLVAGPFGCTPLHCALKSNASVEVVEALISESPLSVRTREATGKLPLHVACQYGASPDVVNIVLMNHPQAIVIRDEDGCRPVEYATKHKFCPNSEAEVVTVLDRAQWYCTVANAAAIRASAEYDARQRIAEAQHDKELEEVRAEGEEMAKQSAEAEAAAREEAQTAAAEVEKLSGTLEELIERGKEERKEAKAMHDELWGDLQKGKEHVDTLGKQLADCEAELAERAGRHAQREGELVATLTNLEDTIQIVTSEAKQLRIRIQDQENLSVVVTELEHKLEETAEDRDDLIEKNKSLDLCVKHLEKEQKKLKEKIHAQENLSSLLTQVEGRLEEALEERDSVQERNMHLEQQLNDKEKELEKAEEENKVRWEAADLLLARVKELENEVEETSAADRKELEKKSAEYELEIEEKSAEHERRIEEKSAEYERRIEEKSAEYERQIEEKSAEYELRIKGLESLLDQANDRAERGVVDEETEEASMGGEQGSENSFVVAENRNDTDTEANASNLAKPAQVEVRDGVVEMNGQQLLSAMASSSRDAEEQASKAGLCSAGNVFSRDKFQDGEELTPTQAVGIEAKKSASVTRSTAGAPIKPSSGFVNFFSNNESWVKSYVNP